MWQLKMTDANQKWIEVGTFETVTAAAARIRALEDYLTTGVFLEIHVDTELGTDEEAFSVLHHTGRRALYGIRRSRAVVVHDDTAIVLFEHLHSAGMQFACAAAQRARSSLDAA